MIADHRYQRAEHLAHPGGSGRPGRRRAGHRLLRTLSRHGPAGQPCPGADMIQGYEMFPSYLEQFSAHIVPWLEFLLGVFLVLGLWLRLTLKAQCLLTASFIVAVGQALLRHLPLEDCGCFGEAFHFPLKTIILLDSALLAVIILLFLRLPKTARFSLDRYFLNHT